MKTVFKYPLNAAGLTRIWIPGYLPAGLLREVCTVALQHDRPQLWVGVDTGEPKVAFIVSLLGTGGDQEAEGIPFNAFYIGTFLLYGDRLVLHAFLHQDPDQTGSDDD